MLLRPVLAAAAVGLAVSVGQYLPTLLIGGGRVATLTTEAVALSSGGNRRIIGTYAMLQMALSGAGVRRRSGDPGAGVPAPARHESSGMTGFRS